MVTVRGGFKPSSNWRVTSAPGTTPDPELSSTRPVISPSACSTSVRRFVSPFVASRTTAIAPTPLTGSLLVTR